MTFGFIVRVNASSGSINISTNKWSVVVGNTVTTTVTLSSGSALGSWEFVLNYDKNILQLTNSNTESGGQTSKGVVNSASQYSKSYTFTFKAIGSGTCNFSIANNRVYAYDESQMSISTNMAKVSVITQAQLEASYSKNNYLSSLGIKDLALTPEFNKDTLEYTIELEHDVTSIVVEAKAEDGTASVNGAGEKAVTPGENNIEIVVTAQNGNERKYIIKATVKELSPINVIVDKKNYTIVRKKDGLTVPSDYTETTVIIGEEEVLAYYNEHTKYTLLALKDNTGDINFYIYNASKNSYSLYKEALFDQVKLSLLEYTGKVPNGYFKTTVKIGDNEITAYKLNKTSKNVLIYGVNINTGKANLYMYDRDENTIQKYYDEEVITMNSKLNSYMLVIIILGAFNVLVLVILMVILMKKRKKKKTKNKELPSEI